MSKLESGKQAVGMFEGMSITCAVSNEPNDKDMFTLPPSRSNTNVAIGKLNDTFLDYLRTAPEVNESFRPLSLLTLQNSAREERIVQEIRRMHLNPETTYSDIAGLLRMQPKGEEGLLRTDGHPNMFFVMYKGSFSAARVVWKSGRRAWHIDILPATDTEWSKNRTFFVHIP